MEYAIERRVACFFSFSLEGYQFNWKKRAKDNSSFSASCSAYPFYPASPNATVGFAGRLSVWCNPGRPTGYLSRKYLQATVQKPNLVCGRLILSYYIPSVDSSGLDPLSPSFERTSFSACYFSSCISPPLPSSPLLRLPLPDNPDKLSKTIRSSQKTRFSGTP